MPSTLWPLLAGWIGRCRAELERNPSESMTVRPRALDTLARRWPAPAIAAVLLWLAFSGGGFFAPTTAIAAMGGSVALLFWVTLEPRPFAGVTALATVAVGALAGLAAWTLLSALWSGSAGRALVEFDRALLYTLVALLASLVFTRTGARRALLWGVAVAGVVICVAGLVTRILPELWSAAPTVHPDRLSYPVGYWNALGLQSAITLIVLFHLSSSLGEHRIVRVLGAAMWPFVAATLFFTFSLGALALVPAGVLMYLFLARPRGAAGAVLAIVPATAVGLAAAYGADALSTGAATAAGVEEGRQLAFILAGCVLAAAAIRVAAFPLDARVARLQRPPAAVLRRAVAVGTACVVPLALIGAVATGGPAWADKQLERFTDGDYVSSDGDGRERLSELGNNGRIPQWRAAIDAFESEPLHGTGAGTYELTWQRTRPYGYDVRDAHSLYAEVLGELGVVGLALVLLALGALLAACLRRVRGPDRPVAAAVAAVLAVWMVHAGIDWHWEMPVVTLPVLALAAAMSGRAPAAATRPSPDRFPRILIGLGCLALALTPALVWQSTRHVQAADRAFERHDCATSMSEALAAIDTLDAQAEPFTLLGYCDLRLGRLESGEGAMLAAVDRDPENWETHYGLALAQALRGRDPRAAARRARELNPESEMARDLVRRFATDDPQTWRRRAAGARLPV